MGGTDLLTVEEVAERLRVSRRAPYKWIREGKLPALQPTPGVIRIRLSDFDAFMGGNHDKLVKQQ